MQVFERAQNSLRRCCCDDGRYFICKYGSGPGPFCSFGWKHLESFFPSFVQNIMRIIYFSLRIGMRQCIHQGGLHGGTEDMKSFLLYRHGNNYLKGVCSRPNVQNITVKKKNRVRVIHCRFLFSIRQNSSKIYTKQYVISM